MLDDLPAHITNSFESATFNKFFMDLLAQINGLNNQILLN